jgi:hypothetical protein
MHKEANAFLTLATLALRIALPEVCARNRPPGRTIGALLQRLVLGFLVYKAH